MFKIEQRYIYVAISDKLNNQKSKEVKVLEQIFKFKKNPNRVFEIFLLNIKKS